MPSSTTDLIDTAVITGGGSGIGKAIAQYLISKDKKVIIVGRTESSLQKTTKEIGATAYYVLDTGKVDTISAFTKKLIQDHPDVNCLVNNAGVQRPFQFPGSGGKEYSFELDKADQEIDINIRGPMHLCVNLLPHFTSLPNAKKAVVMNVSSSLGYLPSSVINPVYNGTKAWVHFFTMNMRTQFKQSDQLKVVEIVPPQVATDLHRERTDPDDNKKGKSSVTLSLEEFMDEVKKGLEEGEDTVTAGPGHALVEAWSDAFGSKYASATET